MSQKVVLVVGTGNVAQTTVKALVQAGQYRVRVLARAGKDLPWVDSSVVEVVRGDVFDKESLAAATAGVFSVISTVGELTSPTLVVEGQKNILDAAEAAGVRQFIPSEFGFDFDRVDPKGPIFEWKKQFLDELKARSAKNPNLSWTSVASASFFEYWCVPVLCVNIPNGTAEVYGTGEESTAFVTMADLGTYIAASVGREDLYNKVVSAVSFSTTWNKVIAGINATLEKPLTVNYVPYSGLVEAYNATDNVLYRNYISIKAAVAKGYDLDLAVTAKHFPSVVPATLESALAAAFPAKQ